MLAQPDKVCSCCGQTLPPPGPNIHLTPSERAIFEVILRAGRYGATTDRLLDALYGDREDGGPLFADKVVWITIRTLREKLAPYGAIINSAGRGRGIVGRYHYEQTS